MTQSTLTRLVTPALRGAPLALAVRHRVNSAAYVADYPLWVTRDDTVAEWPRGRGSHTAAALLAHSAPSSCTSSTTSHNRSSNGARSASSRSVVTHPSRSGAAVTSRTSTDPAAVCRNAASTDSQNRSGSRSPRPAATHAACPARPAQLIQDRSSTVFPLPAGADTTLTRACAPSRPNSRGRDTTPPAPRPAARSAMRAFTSATTMYEHAVRRAGILGPRRYWCAGRGAAAAGLGCLLGAGEPQREQHGDGGEARGPPERDVECVRLCGRVRSDRALEDHGQHGGAERAADLLRAPGEHAGVRDLLLVQADVAGDRHRQDNSPEAEPADDHPDSEQPFAGVRPGQGERDGPGGDDGEAGQGDDA